jgi:hypothetical protein
MCPLFFSDPFFDFISVETIIAADPKTWYFVAPNQLVQRDLVNAQIRRYFREHHDGARHGVAGLHNSLSSASS